jgi:hypothetical protein
MRKNGQTDMTKLIVAFRNFANAPKNCQSKLSSDTDGNTFRCTRYCRLIQHSGPRIRLKSRPGSQAISVFLIKPKSKSTTKSQ